MANKDKLLGMSHGKAGNILRKSILFKFVTITGNNKCFRCGKIIESVDELSIEHKVSWELSDNPIEKFFDLDNISFSHLSCNARASSGGGSLPKNKTHCKNGHEFTTDNTIIKGKYKSCRMCKSIHANTDQYKLKEMEYNKSYYNKNKLRWSKG